MLKRHRAVRKMTCSVAELKRTETQLFANCWQAGTFKGGQAVSIRWTQIATEKVSLRLKLRPTFSCKLGTMIYLTLLTIPLWNPIPKFSRQLPIWRKVLRCVLVALFLLGIQGIASKKE